MIHLISICLIEPNIKEAMGVLRGNLLGMLSPGRVFQSFWSPPPQLLQPPPPWPRFFYKRSIAIADPFSNLIPVFVIFSHLIWFLLDFGDKLVVWVWEWLWELLCVWECLWMWEWLPRASAPWWERLWLIVQKSQIWQSLLVFFNGNQVFHKFKFVSYICICWHCNFAFVMHLNLDLYFWLHLAI